MPNTVTVGVVQLQTGPVRKENLEKASELTEKAVRMGAQIVVLPEMFACPYSLRSFVSEAETFPDGPTGKTLAGLARRNSVWVVGGSFPEASGERIYNASPVFSPRGKPVALHRKVHLFDVNLNELRFQESAVFTPGDRCTVVDTPWGKMGVMICYDVRFPEFARLYALGGSRLLCVPAAFNDVTGPLHWDMLFRCRALDNQLFVVAASPAPLAGAAYQAWGHSMIADPMGRVLGSLEREEGVLVRELDFAVLERSRETLPLLHHRRRDMYPLAGE